MVNNKAKGGAFERRIAHKLTEISGYKWWRTKGSGNTAAESKSDIKPTDRKAPMFIECKSVKSIHLKNILLCSENLAEIIEKIKLEKDKRQKRWALIMKIHLEGLYAITPDSENYPDWWVGNCDILAVVFPLFGEPYTVWKFPE